MNQKPAPSAAELRLSRATLEEVNKLYQAWDATPALTEGKAFVVARARSESIIAFTERVRALWPEIYQQLVEHMGKEHG